MTWLMASFIRDIPTELLESASVMGCSRMKAFWLIIVPLLKPAVASATILVMQTSWNPNELVFSLQPPTKDLSPDRGRGPVCGRGVRGLGKMQRCHHHGAIIVPLSSWGLSQNTGT